MVCCVLYLPEGANGFVLFAKPVPIATASLGACALSAAGDCSLWTWVHVHVLWRRLLRVGTLYLASGFQPQAELVCESIWPLAVGASTSFAQSPKS
jgi:hypothetical protein